MGGFLRVCVPLLSILIASGCYTVTLSPIVPVPSQQLPLTARTEIPPETASYTFDVRSFAAGAANRWRINLGAALVNYAEAYLGSAFAAGNDVVIHIAIEGCDVHDFEAHIDSRFMVERQERTVFDRKYHGQGTGHFAQTFWGGAFAMKSSMRQTTDEALRSIFEQFLTDAKTFYASWGVPDRESTEDRPEGLP